MLVSNVTINTYSKIGYLWNAFKNQILQPKADQWNWSATLHTSSLVSKVWPFVCRYLTTSNTERQFLRLIYFFETSWLWLIIVIYEN